MTKDLANIEDLDTGLEDFGLQDAVVPRLSIVHKEGEFKDSLSGEQFPTIKVIILGLVKQRILWDTDIDDGDQPMCKSTDHKTGYPNLDEETPKRKRFPIKPSGFSADDIEEDYTDENGVISLPCEGCSLKEWGSHPDGKRPFCSEQFTLPVLYDPYDNGQWVPAIITFSKTGIKPIRSYLTSFARSKTPGFTAVTEISLNLQQRGQTVYSVPSFKRSGDTDSDEWREYASQFAQLKDFLQAPPVRPDDDGDPSPKTSDNKAKPPKQKDTPKEEPEVEEEAAKPPKAKKEKAKKEKEPEPVEDEGKTDADDDDEIPF